MIRIVAKLTVEVNDLKMSMKSASSTHGANSADSKNIAAATLATMNLKAMLPFKTFEEVDAYEKLINKKNSSEELTLVRFRFFLFFLSFCKEFNYIFSILIITDRIFKLHRTIRPWTPIITNNDEHIFHQPIDEEIYV